MWCIWGEHYTFMWMCFTSNFKQHLYAACQYTRERGFSLTFSGDFLSVPTTRSANFSTWNLLPTFSRMQWFFSFSTFLTWGIFHFRLCFCPVEWAKSSCVCVCGRKVGLYEGKSNIKRDYFFFNLLKKDRHMTV